MSNITKVSGVKYRYLIYCPNRKKMLKANTKLTLPLLVVLIVWSIVFDIWRRYKLEVPSWIKSVIDVSRPEAQVFEMHRFSTHHFCRIENLPFAMSKS